MWIINQLAEIAVVTLVLAWWVVKWGFLLFMLYVLFN